MCTYSIAITIHTQASYVAATFLVHPLSVCCYYSLKATSFLFHITSRSFKIKILIIIFSLSTRSACLASSLWITLWISALCAVTYAEIATCLPSS